MDIDKTFSELAQFKRIVEEAGKEVERLENEIKALMTERGVDEIFGDEHKAVWTTYEKTQFDTTKFKKENPAMALKYTVTKQQKRFTFA